MSIKLKDDVPVVYCPRRLAYAEDVQLRQIIRDQLECGFTRESQWNYASPMVLVRKKSG